MQKELINYYNKKNLIRYGDFNEDIILIRKIIKIRIFLKF